MKLRLIKKTVQGLMQQVSVKIQMPLADQNTS